MTGRSKAAPALPPLSRRLYSAAQIAAYEGRLPADHPAWSLVPERDDALHDDWARHQEHIRDTQRHLTMHLVVGDVSHLPTVIQQVTGHEITDSMYDGAWHIRRAVFAWVDSGRAEWVNGSLDHFRLLPPPGGVLVSRPVLAETIRDTEPTAEQAGGGR
jgi:hypothetical protein